MALGNYPDMSLAVARVEASKARLQIDTLHDPLTARRAILAEHRQQGLFSELCEDWFKIEIEGRIKHPGVPRRHLDKYLLPKHGRH